MVYATGIAIIRDFRFDCGIDLVYTLLAKEAMRMLEVETRKARQNFSDTLNRVAYGHERVTLTRRGKAIAVMMPIEDARRLEELEDRLDAQLGRQALSEFKKSRAKPVPWEEMKR